MKDSEKLAELERQENDRQSQLKITALQFAANPDITHSGVDSLIESAIKIYNFIK